MHHRARLKKEWRLLLAALVVVDAVALALAVGAAGLLRALPDGVLAFPFLVPERHLVASVLVVPVLLLLFRIQGLYDFDHILAGTREYARIAHAATYGVFIALAASYFAGGEPLVSRSWLVLVWGLSIGCVGLARFTVRRIVRRLRRRGALRTHIVVVGASTFGVAIAEQFRAAENEGLDVVGFLDEYVPLGQRLLGDIAVIGRPGDLANGAHGDLADEYILVPQALPYERVEELTRLMVARDGPAVRVAVSSSDLLTNGVLVAERGYVPLVTLQRARIVGPEALVKRAFDLIGAALALAVLGPLVLTVLGRACVAGKRPIFRRQRISGAGGSGLTLWLFDRSVSMWLPIRGAPALLAVLRGHLSLVGPRPIPYDVDAAAPVATGLTAVKPGVTGPWRLSGARASLADQALQDLTYVRNYSVWEDVRILWESVRRVGHDQGLDQLGRWQEQGASKGGTSLRTGDMLGINR